MRLAYIPFVLLTLALMPISALSEEAHRITKAELDSKFKLRWSTEPPTQKQIESNWARRKAMIFDSLEKHSLGGRVDLTLSCEGNLPVVIMIRKSSPANEFYCSQAIWDAAPYSMLEGSSHPVSFDADSGVDKHCLDIFFSKHPLLKNHVVLVHLIRPAASSSYNIAESDIHCAQNLKAINIDNVNNPLLTEFRKDRSEHFILGNPSLEDLRNEGQRLSH